MITLGRTTLSREGRVVVATFDDGTRAVAHPHDSRACGTMHPFDPTTCDPYAYQRVADAHGTDVAGYVWEHELAHAIVGLQFPERCRMRHSDGVFRTYPPGVSIVLWGLAHGWPTDGETFEAEERAASALQKAWHRL